LSREKIKIYSTEIKLGTGRVFGGFTDESCDEMEIDFMREDFMERAFDATYFDLLERGS